MGSSQDEQPILALAKSLRSVARSRYGSEWRSAISFMPRCRFQLIAIQLDGAAEKGVRLFGQDNRSECRFLTSGRSRFRRADTVARLFAELSWKGNKRKTGCIRFPDMNQAVVGIFGLLRKLRVPVRVGKLG